MITGGLTFNEMVECTLREYHKNVTKELTKKSHLISEEISHERFVDALVDFQEFMFFREENYFTTRLKFIRYFYYIHINRFKEIIVRGIKSGRIEGRLRDE